MVQVEVKQQGQNWDKCDKRFLRLIVVFILGTGGAEMYPGQT